MPAVAPRVALLDRPDEVRLALSPIRRRLLARLRQPGSATTLATEMAMGRQRVNYHLRALEHAGLLTLVETRQKRGCQERVVVATARAFVVDPAVVGDPHDTRAPDAAQDHFAAEHLIGTAAAMVRDVTRMQARAQQQRRRLLTFAVEADVRLRQPADFARFSTALAAALARTAAAFEPAQGGRTYRVVIGSHPTPRPAEKEQP